MIVAVIGKIISAKFLAKNIFRFFFVVVIIIFQNSLFAQCEQEILNAYDSRDYNKTLNLILDFNKKEKRRSGVIQYLLAQMHLWGEGVVQDRKLWIKYLTESAELGYILAEYNLASTFIDGIHHQRDIGKAIYWFEKAAEQGHLESILSLASIYEEGLIVDTNLEKAYFWYGQASAPRSPMAFKRFNEIGKFLGKSFFVEGVNKNQSNEN